MTVRVAQQLGVDKIAKFSRDLKIYDNPEELISISLGSAETTLLKLTTAYCSFVNGGKLIEPILVDRIQDSEGFTIYNSEKRKCKKCEEISFLGKNFPKITDNFTQIFSEQTAYQITSILEGAVKRGTGRGLRDLNFIGADVVEVSPPFDINNMTSLVGATIAFEILCTMTRTNK